MEDEILDLVDEDDNIIGQAKRSEVARKRLLHRGVAVFVFNSKGEVFIHQRSEQKEGFPSIWDCTCGGAVSAGESYEEAARRESQEELGLKGDFDLEFLFSRRDDNPRINLHWQVFRTIYDGKMTLQEEEVKQGYFVPFERLDELMKELDFCPGAIKAHQALKEINKKKIRK